MNIKIGGRTFSVEMKMDEILNHQPDAHGYINYQHSKIIIGNDSSGDFQAENLLHEILHALLDNSGKSEINNEEIIKLLTPRLHGFLIDNPLFQKNLLEINK